MFRFTKNLTLIIILLSTFQSFTQNKKDKKDEPTIITAPTPTPVPEKPKTTGPKAFKEVITEKAKTSIGLFTTHKIDEKYYFEIADSVMGKEVMAITRMSKSMTVPGAVGLPSYGGEELNSQVIRFEKGPDNKVFLRAVSYINVSNDENTPIYKAVRNSNVDPIAAAFDIKAIRKDTSVVIDVTDFFKSENPILSMSAFEKSVYKLTSLQADRTYIQSAKAYPINTEVRVVRTYGVSLPMPTLPTQTPSPIPSITLPGARTAGAITMEVNTSMILLPKNIMRQRPFDLRIGYYANGYSEFGENSQRVDDKTFAVRWRLEAKNKVDEEIQKKGGLIEPKKPIVYYIDPATPKKWRNYLKSGVDDWQIAFEQAGWKNAIRGEILADNDTTINLEDARYSAIRYFASDIENAYGPNISDPRSGEILESHIGWYHNVMKLLKKWYMTQTAASDPRSRKNVLDDALMGELIRFVSSHEVGHTLGLRHNFGASNTTPVEKLRDKEFIAKNGHTSSIMDYARFNYVAQPEDGITDFFPRIGDYDKWAIEWAYKPIYETKSPEEDKQILNKWYNEKVTVNNRLRFLTETNPYDPRAQSEDLGDNAMIASDYGIKNLKRIVPNLNEWTKSTGENFEQLEESYNDLVGQYRRYMGHVTKNIGGVYETPKNTDQGGQVYEATPKNMQKDAMIFLNKQLFETPNWLLDQNILGKIRPDGGIDFISKMQEVTLNSILANDRLQRIIESSNQNNKNYTIDELIGDLKSGIWFELKTKKAIDNYRRNLQKVFVEKMASMLNPPVTPAILSNGTRNVFGAIVPNPTDSRKSDIVSVVRGNVLQLQKDIKAALPSIQDKMSKYHLQDCLARIERSLDPK